MAQKILVVDDNPATLRLAQVILEEAGYEVALRQHAMGTGAAMVREKADLVLIDMNMPTLRGDELVEALNQYRGAGGAPLILWSDMAESELADAAARCHADGWIKKSADVDTLAKHVAAILARPR